MARRLFKIGASRVPRSEPARRPAAGDLAAAPERPRAPATGLVLVVEDEEPVRRLVAHTLREHGLSVLEAGSGREALRVAEAHPRPIDVVVSDVVIPDFRGPERAGQSESAGSLPL